MFLKSALIILTSSITLLGASCIRSVKPVYNDEEIAAAERAVAQLHDLYNRADFGAITQMMQVQPHAPKGKEITENITTSFKSFGRVKNSRLIQKKVFPSPSSEFSSQVKLAYETTFENGAHQELFAWNIRKSGEAVLVEYRID